MDRLAATVTSAPRPRWCASLVLAAAMLAAPSLGDAAPFEGVHVRADLVSEHETIRPGEPFDVGILLLPEEGWHTYWRSPGRTGLPTKVKWTLPPGFRAGEIAWPHPVRLGEPPYVAFGYEGDVLLPVTIQAPPGLVAGTLAEIRASVSWLVCRDDACVPGKADLDLAIRVEVEPPAPDSRWTELFTAARAALPRTLDGWSATARDEGGRLRVRVRSEGSAKPSTANVALYALDGDAFDPSAEQRVVVREDGFDIEVARDRDGALADPLALVLVAEGGWDEDGDVVALELDATVERAATAAAGNERDAEPVAEVAAEPAPQAPRAAPPAGEAPAPPMDATVHGDGAPNLTLVAAVAFAFLGGLILNLMPCVFPVLTLKILGFVHAAHSDPQRVRHHGYAFGAGVLTSFWVLAGALIALRAAGNSLGWGFQLQQPIFVALIAVLLFVLSLNLLGLFEVGSSLVAAAGRYDSASGYRGSFASGILATVLATPCSAPFMGTAVGYALVQPAAASLAVFTSLGAGMAAPYVTLACAPPLLRRLPKPGPWMETFRQVMAFPLLATVVWLVWVFGQQTGNDGVLRLLSSMLLAMVAAWAFGRPHAIAAAGGRAPGPGHRFAYQALAAAGAVLALVVASGASRHGAAEDCATSAAADATGVAWVAFDADAISRHRAEGRPVFVDFTAAWCLSCKVNERVALSSSAFADKVRSVGAVAMKADWTNGDPAITRALEAFGRSGVPLYVLYPADPARDAIVLPQILTPEIVLSALDRVA